MTNLLAIASAVKGKAPIVAIPVEGAAPICIRRKVLAGWSKGVTIQSMKLGEHRWLHLAGIAKNGVVCKASFAPISRINAMNELYKWTAKERENRKKGAKSSKWDLAVRRLEKEIGDAPKVVYGWNRKAFRVDDYDRQTWMNWRVGKQRRTEAFRDLIDKCGSVDAARACIHTQRPTLSVRYWTPKFEDMWGVERYRVAVEWLKQTKPIREQIVEIRRMEGEAKAERANAA